MIQKSLFHSVLAGKTYLKEFFSYPIIKCRPIKPVASTGGRIWPKATKATLFTIGGVQAHKNKKIFVLKVYRLWNEMTYDPPKGIQ